MSDAEILNTRQNILDAVALGFITNEEGMARLKALCDRTVKVPTYTDRELGCWVHVTPGAA